MTEDRAQQLLPSIGWDEVYRCSLAELVG